MSEKEETLNAGPEKEEVTDDGSSPSTEDTSFQKHGDLVSTVEVEPPKDESSEEALKTEETEDGEGKETGEEISEEEIPEEFHKHPAWQRIMKERDEKDAALQVAEGKLQVFETVKSDPIPIGDPKATEEEVPYKDISTLSEKEIDEWWEDDKVGLMANLAQQVAHETEQRVMGIVDEKGRTDRANETFQKFGDKHPDFWELWGDGKGKIAQLMETSLGHNAISAYYELKEESTQKEIDAKIAEAKAEGEKAALKKLKVKGSAANLLGAGPSTAGQVKTPEDQRMKDPKKFGGDTAVLAQRLKERRERGES
jgi:hypothetical protein